MTKRYYVQADAPDGHLVVTASVTAQNTFTEATEFDMRRPFNVSIEGTWSATVLLQRSFDGGTTWYTVGSYTSVQELLVDTTESGVLWRCGVATGGFTSGTVAIRLSQ